MQEEWRSKPFQSLQVRTRLLYPRQEEEGYVHVEEGCLRVAKGLPEGSEAY
jgi:hypothetical protein